MNWEVQINISEANKIIAEYMEVRVNSDDESHIKIAFGIKTNPVYSESLDLLVPVWDKLAKVRPFDNGIIIYSCIVDDMPSSFDISSNWVGKGKIEISLEEEEEPPTIQEAAAISTAKTIESLNENN